MPRLANTKYTSVSADVFIWGHAQIGPTSPSFNELYYSQSETTLIKARHRRMSETDADEEDDEEEMKEAIEGSLDHMWYKSLIAKLVWKLNSHFL